MAKCIVCGYLISDRGYFNHYAAHVRRGEASGSVAGIDVVDVEQYRDAALFVDIWRRKHRSRACRMAVAWMEDNYTDYGFDDLGRLRADLERWLRGGSSFHPSIIFETKMVESECSHQWIFSAFSREGNYPVFKVYAPVDWEMHKMILLQSPDFDKSFSGRSWYDDHRDMFVGMTWLTFLRIFLDDCDIRDGVGLCRKRLMSTDGISMRMRLSIFKKNINYGCV